MWHMQKFNISFFKFSKVVLSICKEMFEIQSKFYTFKSLFQVKICVNNENMSEFLYC